MKYKIFLICISFSMVLFFGCSDTEPDITVNNSLGVHGKGFADPTSNNFHAATLRLTNWKLDDCKSCHAADYSGGTAKVSCKSSGCHASSRGPESCNTCHGDFNNSQRIAPPRAIGGALLTSDRGVGVHTTHAYDVKIAAANLSCYDCHPHITVVGSYVKSHINGLPAELSISGLALTKSNTDSSFSRDPNRTAFIPNPSYDLGNGTCSQVYCHGYFKNGNINNVVSWTKDPADNTRIKCGSCHGDVVTGNPLPTGTHPQGSFASNCSMCHTNEVTYANNTWTITDSTKHINGKLNIYGAEQRL